MLRVVTYLVFMTPLGLGALLGAVGEAEGAVPSLA